MIPLRISGDFLEISALHLWMNEKKIFLKGNFDSRNQQTENFVLEAAREP